ncbi:MAG: flippase-like domain-containing protein [Deltaproteobacteria bacterium]|nr:flippase-like domain-containing protein [Deltaproteobacteria bacterium]
MRSIFLTLLKIGVSGVLLYLLFSRMDGATFWKTVTEVPTLSIASGLLIFASVQCVSALRWRILIAKDTIVPYSKLVSMYFIGMFFNNFLPTLIGGDVIKGYYLYKATGRGDLSVTSVFMDRYVGLTALILITTISLAIGYSTLNSIGGAKLVIPFLIFIGGFVFSSALLWVNFLHNWFVKILLNIHLYGLNQKIETFYKVFMSYKKYRQGLFKAFGISIIIQLGVIGGYIIIGSGIGMEVHPGYYFLFIPLGTAIAMIPLSLSGLGIREGAFVFLFSKAGATGEQAIALSLIWFFVMALVSIIGGIEYIRVGKAKT